MKQRKNNLTFLNSRYIPKVGDIWVNTTTNEQFTYEQADSPNITNDNWSMSLKHTEDEIEVDTSIYPFKE